MNVINKTILAMVIGAALAPAAFAADATTSVAHDSNSPVILNTAQPGHFIPQPGIKIEDDSNRTGNALKRAIINKAEHNEAVAHEARYQGMISHDPESTTTPRATIEDQVSQNTSDIANHAVTLEQHHRVLVAAGNEMQSIRDTATDNAANIAKLTTTTDTHTKALNSTMQAVFANDKAIHSLKDDVTTQTATNDNQQQLITNHTKSINENSLDIQSVAEYAKSNHDQVNLTKSTVEGLQKQDALQNGSRIQSMIAAKHNAEQAAIQRQITAQNVSITATSVDHSKDIAANKASINATHTAITKLAQQQKDDLAHYSAQVQTLANGAASAIDSDRQQIASAQQRVERNSAQLSKLNSNFSSLKHTVDENKHEAAAGSSSAMAQANIPQVLNGQTVAVGAGVGGYDGESAIAVGVSFRAADSVTVKATVSDDSQQNVGYGAGVSVGW
ncbi:hypothetical protein GCM10011445_38420 [Pseudocitrobacter faecalis]|uniref:YadA C-terminal domain-containing protein n=1 Tax=Pseudocitrobacter faecalis TaxID=1398493 RepID=UPI001679CDC3|nr:YadA C-terminal domain-containing protein [Pseudocitrobacter faecalis]GHD96959.1 hypothetical protein GCM10011445_38420 [Pseudocitrobacter faecalis]